MKNFVEKNEEILQKWEQEMLKNGEENFAPDGIMYRGKIIFNESESSIREQNSNAENKLWNNAPLRLLFLTKDQNTGGDDAWDVRGERFFSKNCIIPKMKSTIFQNEKYIFEEKQRQDFNCLPLLF